MDDRHTDSCNEETRSQRVRYLPYFIVGVSNNPPNLLNDEHFTNLVTVTTATTKSKSLLKGLRTWLNPFFFRVKNWKQSSSYKRNLFPGLPTLLKRDSVFNLKYTILECLWCIYEKSYNLHDTLSGNNHSRNQRILFENSPY